MYHFTVNISIIYFNKVQDPAPEKAEYYPSVVDVIFCCHSNTTPTQVLLWDQLLRRHYYIAPLNI